jgi:hypothetical protein
MYDSYRNASPYNILSAIEIINNTRRDIEGEIWERGDGGKLKSRMNITQFLGYTWNQKNLKQESQNLVFLCFGCHYYKDSPKNVL